MIEILKSYIPLDRRLAIIQGQPLSDRCEGSALFADISGFTPLTEGLVKHLGETKGAEELIGILNRVYTALVGQVHNYGGSVIGFTGDAITCWFDGDEGLRATACGLALQEEMKSFARLTLPAGEVVSLTIKVGLASGPARRFVVGNPQMCYMDVLAGETLQRMTAAEGQAKKGEVLLDPQTLQAIREKVTLTEERPHAENGQIFGVVGNLKEAVTPHPWLALAEEELTKDQVRGWLLPAIYDRWQAGQGQFLAELRPVSALFLKFSGLDYDQDEAAGEKLDAYIQWVQQTVAHYDGSLIQLTIGDKGSYLYVVFGAPVAHGDDAVRAVAVALHLQTPPTRFSFISNTQIGLARGQMCVGDYGGEYRRTYGAIGDATMLAARLMGIAPPNQSYCGYTTYQASQDHFVFDILSPVRVKGKASLIITKKHY